MTTNTSKTDKADKADKETRRKETPPGFEGRLERGSLDYLEKRYLELLKRCLTDTVHYRYDGWKIPRPEQATMVPPAHLDNLQALCVAAILEGVPGDFMECGVWRGGACVLMAAVVDLLGDGFVDRKDIIVADSFHGMRAPTDMHDRGQMWHEVDWVRATKEQVIESFRTYDLYDPTRVRMIEGYFEDTLPTADVKRLAVLRSDCDLYGPTMAVMESMYPKLQPGGYFIEDDYFNPGFANLARQAVDDYRTSHGVSEPVIAIQGPDSFGAYWRKEK